MSKRVLTKPLGNKLSKNVGRRARGDVSWIWLGWCLRFLDAKWMQGKHCGSILRRRRRKKKELHKKTKWLRWWIKLKARLVPFSKKKKSGVDVSPSLNDYQKFPSLLEQSKWTNLLRGSILMDWTFLSVLLSLRSLRRCLEYHVRSTYLHERLEDISYTLSQPVGKGPLG